MPDKKWTADNMPDLTGKVVIVTGANSGIGLGATIQFARKGACTIMACRNVEKAQDALKQIEDDIPDVKAEIITLDLASLTSVRQFVDEFKARFNRLDVLVNNAGIMNVPYGTTEDGFELHFGINHLGHFALTGLLIDLILQTPDSRVVNVSSGGHLLARMDFDDLMYQKGKKYSEGFAYGQSKLANVLFTYELQRRFEAGRYDAKSMVVHPGWTETNLQVYSPNLQYLNRFLSQDIHWGALPTLYAAVAEEAVGGAYYGPDGLFQLHGHPTRRKSSKASHSIPDAKRLWEVSEELTGVDFGAL